MTLRASLRSALRTILRFLCHPLCRHTETLTKTAGIRVYTECLRCEYQSKGVVIAGHDYASTKHSWEPVRVTTAAESEAIENKWAEDNTKKLSVQLPPVAIVQETARPLDDIEKEVGLTTTSLLGNLAGHATSARRKSVASAKHKPRKISVKSVRKTPRKPSSKRSKTA